jgi:glycosyltransferase involved in cell wall biosynthesis
MSRRKKILWLASWYPNRDDPFDGDFIQRHARAAALYDDIHVIFVRASCIDKPIEEKTTGDGRLTEQVIYYRQPSGVFAYFRKQWKWRKLYLKAAEEYIARNGKPHCIHVHIPWKAGVIALMLKARHKIPFVLTEHWGRYNKELPGHLESSPVFEQKLVKRVFEEAAAFLPVSHYLAQGVQQMVTPKPYTVIPNVVDTSLFFPITEKHSRFTFLHVSNMAPVKNVDGILKAFHSAVFEHGMKDARLLLIGNRDDHFQKQADSLGLSNHVSFLGEIPYTEVAKQMQRSHCLVLNSTAETFSCVTAEALCCGLPVIAPRIGALPELVNETNGLLFEKESLLQAMIAVKKNYAHFDTKLISAEAAARFNYEAVGEMMSSGYEKVVG